ncbi:alpha-ketoglutarate-dependent dioxygenase AlkB [Massilia sp. IC2-477]|uniref:alpha-ketoglutarate-dependent dioxygenase AlkB family protein n=1 Tax=Massilia sp. IC2-477 TaxID=2887198 RepID=UPI001D103C50|nr:alpha-ketoglutarate-dependent dioxygenase AlkB [Massilia sp. IC2-477]MCC2954995.1 alpha-ketoglutarate-dependent dioxygenase AlkB [Massilia sp. IC2-477]
MDLFAPAADLKPIPIPIRDGELAFLPQLPLPWPNEEVLARLITETDWREESVVVYGKRHLQPRLSAWHGEKGYRYSGLSLAPLPFTPLLDTIRRAAEEATGRRYNSVLLNYYRDGRDSMGMHSDDEPELGLEPAIASVSFGATRPFILRHKLTKETLKLPLTDGSLLFMAGQMQANWMHGINKTAKPTGPRLNLTFRNIV